MADEPRSQSRTGELRRIADEIEAQFMSHQPPASYPSEWSFGVKLDFRDWHDVVKTLRATAPRSETAPTVSKLWPTCEELARRDIALTEAAHDLLMACDMEQHNEDIFKGKWKKGSKAWDGDFVAKNKQDAMERIRALTDPRKPVPAERAGG